jgi:PAS domain S-box-containing protein
MDESQPADMDRIVAACQSLSSVLAFDELVQKLVARAMDHTGAQRGALLLVEGDARRVAVEARASSGGIEVKLRPTGPRDVWNPAIEQVVQTGRTLVFEAALPPETATAEPVIRGSTPPSVLCVPIMGQRGEVSAVLYLESHEARIERPVLGLEMLARQATISFENARLYADLLRENVERKCAEDTLRRSNALLAEAQRLSLTGSFRWHVASGGLQWSDETYSLLGVERDSQPTIEKVLQRVHPEDLTFVRETLERAAREAGELHLEHRLVASDGSVKFVQVLARPAAEQTDGLTYVGAVIDVTKEQCAQLDLEIAFRDLQTLKDQSRLAIDTIPGLVWTGRVDGYIDFLNQRWLDYTGLTSEQACGSGWVTAIHPADLPAVLETWHRILVAREAGEVIARLRRFDGVYRWFVFRAVPLFDDHAELLKWYGQTTDVDDRIRAEMRLAEEKQLLERIAKGEALHPILAEICLFIERMSPGVMASILLLDAKAERLWQGAGPTLPAGLARAIDGTLVGPTGGPCGRAAFKNQRVFVSDIASDPIMADFIDLANEYGLMACWSMPISLDGKVLGTFAIYLREAGGPTAEQLNVIEQVTNLASIAIERARVLDALQRSEAYLTKAQRLSLTGSFSWVPNGELRWSDETFRIYGYESRFDVSLEDARRRVHPEDVALFGAVAKKAIDTGEDFEFEHRLLMSDGTVKHVHVVSNASVDEAGRLIEYLGAVSDITASKREEARLQAALEEREALLKEVHHRVKNNLQLISSLLNLQASWSSDPAVAALFVDSRNRVQSMASVHENLYRAGDFAKVAMHDHIENLCAQLTRAYDMHTPPLALSIQVSDLRLGLDTAMSCGLIINELVSNAMKHAFPDGSTGGIYVALHAGAGEEFVLTVRDDGIGLPPGLEVGRIDTLGLQLVHDLTMQLRGSIAIRREGGGTSFAITFIDGERALRSRGL